MSSNRPRTLTLRLALVPLVWALIGCDRGDSSGDDGESSASAVRAGAVSGGESGGAESLEARAERLLDEAYQRCGAIVDAPERCAETASCEWRVSVAGDSCLPIDPCHELSESEELCDAAPSSDCRFDRWVLECASRNAAKR